MLRILLGAGVLSLLTACAPESPRSEDVTGSAAGGGTRADVSMTVFSQFDCGTQFPRAMMSGGGVLPETVPLPFSRAEMMQMNYGEEPLPEHSQRTGVRGNGNLYYLGLPVLAFEEVVEFDLGVDWLLVDAPVREVVARLASEQPALGPDFERYRQTEPYSWPNITGEYAHPAGYVYYVDLVLSQDAGALRRYATNDTPIPRGPDYYRIQGNGVTGSAGYNGDLVVLSQVGDRALVGCSYEPDL